MFSRILTKKSTQSFSKQIDRLKAALQECDAVVIGAGAGLSASAGFAYTGERFERWFSDFAEKYGTRDMYSGGFYPFATPEEHWSRYIWINRYMDASKPVYICAGRECNRADGNRFKSCLSRRSANTHGNSNPDRKHSGSEKTRGDPNCNNFKNWR